MTPPSSQADPGGSRRDPGVDAAAALLRLQTFARSLLQQQSLDDLLWHIADMVGNVFGFEDCVVYLLEPQGLVQSAAFGVKSPALRQIVNRIVLPPGRGIVGSAASTGRSERVADTRADPRYVADEFAGRSELAVPIAYGGRVLGVLDSESSAVDGFSAADQATLELVATLAAPRIASALAERGQLAAEQALQRAEERQRAREREHQNERLESLGLLAGGIAHDFNNLLMAILGNVALAGERGAGPDVVELLRDAAAACQRATGLTRQLLAFASGGAPVRAVQDVDAALREAVEATKPAGGLEIRYTSCAGPLHASFDRAQLGQLVGHLVRNAAEAQPGGGRLRVEVAKRSIDGVASVEARFHDDGPGVPALLRGRIFDPYFTTRPAAAGLGLSTSFWIARRHGGSLELDPNAPSGACFVLRLPLADPVAGEPVLMETRESRRPLSVLVVDDDPAVRQVTVRMLHHLGHRAVATADGTSALRELAAARQAGSPHDIALVDLVLAGGMDGLETLMAIRQVAPAMPAIVVSGYSETGALAASETRGFQGRLEKPFTSQALGEALVQAMGKAIAGLPSSGGGGRAR